LRGTLFLIVGPSGAGKDTLLRAARERTGADFIFPRRTITRPADPADEDHLAEDVASFDARERAGDFALSWRAHGHAYGIPSAIAADLAQGRHVVANVSREVIEDARKRFAPVRVILITAPPDVLAARLAARAREGDHDVTARLTRRREIEPDATIVNDAAPETAIEAFLAVLKG
jgi:phosphonate metabolism protein PhnN/1,5-bisphosphokinase (PRPP-forming)